MELLIQCISNESRDMQIASGMEEGMQESYDDLEDVAKSLAVGHGGYKAFYVGHLRLLVRGPATIPETVTGPTGPSGCWL